MVSLVLCVVGSTTIFVDVSVGACVVVDVVKDEAVGVCVVVVEPSDFKDKNIQIRKLNF